MGVLDTNMYILADLLRKKKFRKKFQKKISEKKFRKKIQKKNLEKKFRKI
jgi:hypothetical protein